MNDIKRNHDELQTRREFFKKAARGVLPIIGAVTLTPLLTACPGGDDPTGCEGCEGTCSSSCSTTCKGTSSSGCTGCSAQCQSDCDTSCSDACTTTCNNTCTSSSGNTGSNDSSISEADGKVDGYEYVDLGLSVKWARYNMGASSPEKYGSLYWPLNHDSSDFSDCWNSGSISGTYHDVPYNQWSRKWRTPSEDELKELLNNCTADFVEYKGINGLKLTSKKNGKSIFLPAAGAKERPNNSWKSDGYEGKYGNYWTGTINYQYNYHYLVFLEFSKNSVNIIETRDYTDSKFSFRPITNGSGSSSGCSGNCTANCANNSTSSSCSSCANSCSTGCKTECLYNCAATCNDHCYGSCNDTCGGSCTYRSSGSSCSGCATTCYNRCYSDCTRACSTNCASTCVHGSK